MRILLATDKQEIAAAVLPALEQCGFSPQLLDRAAAIEDEVVRDGCAAIVIDGALEREHALKLCARIRALQITTPVLLLTRKGAVRDRVAGLECGADDCLAKPFTLEELAARLRALIRRHRTAGSQRIAVGDLVIDAGARTVARGNREIPLTQREYALLKALALNQGQIVSRKTIQRDAWGDEFSTSNTVDVHIRNLRRKIDDDYPNKLIHTVVGAGYMLGTRQENAGRHLPLGAKREGQEV